jgi:NAD-dependent dihydropyrimidine dehydrogenase PreA subunit
MAEEKKPQMWHGIPRQDIPWFPTVDADACIGCTLCYVSCGRGVYEMQDNKAVPVNAMSCMVGCSTCGTVCPVEAITFPTRDLIWKLEREHKIFNVVRKESKEKMTKAEAAKARAAAEDAVAQLTTRVRVELAGEFGEKRFLIKLEELIKEQCDCFDIVNLRLEVPTLQGALQKTPAYLVFEVTSTEQEDVQPIMSKLRALVRENDLVWVSENKM